MKLLNIYEALQELHISKEELLKLVDTNQISVIVDENNAYYFTPGFIMAYINRPKDVVKCHSTPHNLKIIPKADQEMLKNDRYENDLISDDD
ncbi:MAG: hypothetical protein K6G48_04410 [Acholeplasmatales bacterium]|nr:hypothetical protein [Acholeplasmatales bacterium]